MFLRHNLAHCAGSWHRHESMFWRCDGCDAIAYNCPATLYEIGQDELLAQLLGELTREGHRLLEQGGSW